MSYQHGRGGSTFDSWIGGDVGGASAGKRTLTGQLQLRARGDAAAAEDPVTNYHGLEHSTVGGDAQSIAAHGISGSASALPYADQIQASFGRHSIAGISAHVGGAASEATGALGAHGYATGSSVAFAGAPSLHTAAHEAAHVVQQRAGVHLKGGMGESGDAHERHADAVADAVVRGESAESLLDQYSGGGGGGGGGVQFSLVRPAEVMPGMGTFNVNFQTRNSPTPGPGQPAGLDGFIQFTPMAGAPNSNTIGIIQIAKGTNPGDPNTDMGAGSLHPGVTPRGALGQPGLTTADNAATGVVGGYSTDVLHTGGTLGQRPAGQEMSPRYAVEPTTPANQAGAWAGATVGPRGGTGGIGELSRGGLTPGFKRSDLPEDIRSVQLYDTPNSGDTDLEFESVVKGEDTGTIYGTCLWGFGVRAGLTTNEHISFTAGTSATFNEALERHRDFYVHEPVTIYFAFDRDNVDAVQNGKITGLAEYLRRNPAVHMTLDGFADNIGNAAYNVGLSERRVANVRAAIAAAHPAITPAQIVSNTVVPASGAAAAHPNAGGHGESNDATEAPVSETPAGTGDQGGNAANGADQTREANRQFNRRVTITFTHPAGTGPTAPGGVANPAPAAGP